MSAAASGWSERLQRHERWMPVAAGSELCDALTLDTPLTLLDRSAARPALREHLDFIDAERVKAQSPRWCATLRSSKGVAALSHIPSPIPTNEGPSQSERMRAALEKALLPFLQLPPLTADARAAIAAKAAELALPTHTCIFVASIAYVLLETKCVADGRPRSSDGFQPRDVLPAATQRQLRCLLDEVAALWASQRSELAAATATAATSCVPPSAIGCRPLVFVPGMRRFAHPALCAEAGSYRPPGLAPTLRIDYCTRLAVELQRVLREAGPQLLFDPVATLAARFTRVRAVAPMLAIDSWIVDVANPCPAELANLLAVYDVRRGAAERIALSRHHVDFVRTALDRHFPSLAILIDDRGLAAAAVQSDGLLPHLVVTHSDGSETDLGSSETLGHNATSALNDESDEGEGESTDPSPERVARTLRAVASAPLVGKELRGESFPPLRLARGAAIQVLERVLRSHPNRFALIGCGLQFFGVSADLRLFIVRRCGQVVPVEHKLAFRRHDNGLTMLRGEPRIRRAAPTAPPSSNQYQQQQAQAQRTGPTAATVAGIKRLYAAQLRNGQTSVELRPRDLEAMLLVARCNRRYYDGLRGCGIADVHIVQLPRQEGACFAVRRVCGEVVPLDESLSFDESGNLLPQLHVDTRN